MPYRQVQFANKDYYHIFNKTIDHREPFLNSNLCTRYLETALYYRGSDLQISFSRWKNFSIARRYHIEQKIQNPSNFKVSVVAFCLMPNHFHFVLQQNTTDGIQEFMSNLTNSFTRFFNLVHGRKGPLFLNRFHSVPIMSKEQLLYTTRYVHLNPLAARTVNTFDHLQKYPWSSYRDYVQASLPTLTQTDILLAFFRNSRNLLQKYVENELDREQTLEYVRETEYVRAVLQHTTLGVTPKVV